MTAVRDPFAHHPPRLAPCVIGACLGVALLLASPAAQQRGTTSGPAIVPAGFDGLFLHDVCTGEFAPQPDTCLHEQRVERSFAFGGEPGTAYDVTLRIRGIFEPTVIEGGETPDPAHPYFKIGGTLRSRDWSHWHLDVSEPRQTYTLNHYPSVSHIVHKEDFEAVVAVAAGATVVVRVVDGNDRQMDNSERGRPDRLQIIEGVADAPLPGQMLRLDVIRVRAR
jgi:hypothetical protein